MKSILSTPMHPKAPLIAGVAIVVFTLLGMYAMPFFFWLDILAGAALIYLGTTGHCVLSGAMSTCSAKKTTTSGSVELL